MNIFDIYLIKIKELILKLNKNGLIQVPENLNSINVDSNTIHKNYIRNFITM